MALGILFGAVVLLILSVVFFLKARPKEKDVVDAFINADAKESTFTTVERANNGSVSLNRTNKIGIILFGLSVVLFLVGFILLALSV